MAESADTDNLILDLEEKELPEVEIEIVKTDDKAKEPEKVVKTEVTPEEGLEKLQRQLAESESRTQEAQRHAREQAQAAATARAEAQDSNLNLVTNAIGNLTQTKEVLKANLADAMAAGDWAGASDIQSQMSDNAAKLLQLEQGKQALENMPEPQVQQFQTAQADPVEALASQLSPRSAAWVRQHPEFAREKRQTDRMLAAHNLAIGDGYVPDTDDYFTAIESTLRISLPGEAPIRRDTPPASAPVTRSTTTNGSKPNVVRLTAQEREMAEMMGMSDAEYAKNKYELQKEGKLN